jgi:polar amino acid transport system substrate-binding protein
MKRLLSVLICLASFVHNTSYAEVFTAHCRNYPPEISFDGEKCIGALPELLTDIINDLGHEIAWLKVPWIRSLQIAKDGEVDLLIRHSMTKEREFFLDASPYGYFTRELSFYKAPTFNSDVNSYEDIKRHHIGAIRGNFYSPKFSTLDTKTLTLVGETEQLIGMLELGRIDLAVTSSSHSEELFTDRFERIKFVDSFVNPLYLSVPKGSKASKYYKKIDKLLFEYRKNKKIGHYFKKYGLEPPEQIFKSVQ